MIEARVRVVKEEGNFTTMVCAENLWGASRLRRPVTLNSPSDASCGTASRCKILEEPLAVVHLDVRRSGTVP
jgi:hypothetical protein